MAGGAPADYVGLDVGGTFLKGARISEDGRVLDRLHQPIVRDSSEALLRQLESAVEALGGPGRPRAVGIGLPGTIDQATGRLRGVPNLPSLAALKHVHLADEVRRRLRCVVALENDANAAGLAEAWLGAGRGVRHVVFLTLGTGVGGAVILDGRLWTGASGYAGEIGHMQVDPRGVACGCGSRGCLETIVGNRGWTRRAQEALASRASGLTGRRLDPAAIVEEARRGDGVAVEVVDETARALGEIIGSILNLLNVERVVLAGGIAAAGDFLLERVVRETAKRCWPEVFSDCSFRVAELGGDAGVVGAARAAMLAVVPAAGPLSSG